MDFETRRAKTMESFGTHALGAGARVVFSFKPDLVCGEIWPMPSRATQMVMNRTPGFIHTIQRGYFVGTREMDIASPGDEIIRSDLSEGDLYNEVHTFGPVFIFEAVGIDPLKPEWVGVGKYGGIQVGVPVKEFKLEWIVGIAPR